MTGNICLKPYGFSSLLPVSDRAMKRFLVPQAKADASYMIFGRISPAPLTSIKVESIMYTSPVIDS